LLLGEAGSQAGSAEPLADLSGERGVVYSGTGSADSCHDKQCTPCLIRGAQQWCVQGAEFTNT
jgi:hypothetical protein